MPSHPVTPTFLSAPLSLPSLFHPWHFLSFLPFPSSPCSDILTLLLPPSHPSLPQSFPPLPSIPSFLNLLIFLSLLCYPHNSLFSNAVTSPLTFVPLKTSLSPIPPPVSSLSCLPYSLLCLPTLSPLTTHAGHQSELRVSQHECLIKRRLRLVKVVLLRQGRGVVQRIPPLFSASILE